MSCGQGNFNPNCVLNALLNGFCKFFFKKYGPKRQSVGRNEEYDKENVASAHNNNDDAKNGREVRSPSRMAKEEIYQSRKLLIRQMQGMIAKDQHKNNRQGKSNRSERRVPGEVVSEYDSWSDLEENFAKGFLIEIT